MPSPSSMSSPPPPAPSRHPRGLYTLFFTEMWERFSYYGMRALLVLFMTDAVVRTQAAQGHVRGGGLGFSDEIATAIYGLYTAMVYLMALPGGWMADRLLGARRAVWYGGIIIAAGHFTLAIPATETFFLGLLLVVLGTGLLKPNISVIVGDLYPEGGARRDAGFSIFYMGINLGALVGPLICSTLGEKFNWHYGFAAAGVGMVLGLIQYRATAGYLGEAGLYPRKKMTAPQPRVDPAWYVVLGGLGLLLVVVILGLMRVVQFNPVPIARNASYAIVGFGALYFAGIFLFGKLDAVEKKRTFVLLVLLAASAMFWSGFEQAGSSLNLFAERCTQRSFAIFDRVLPAAWAARINPIPTGWFQSLNPIFIIVLAPIFGAMWVALARRNLAPSLPAKFALGLILLGAGFLVMAAAAKSAAAGRQVWPTWLIATYLLHTFGELCLSPVGLSAVTKLAPPRFVGQMMGVWFLAASLGNLIAGLIASEFAKGTEALPAMFMQIVVTTAGAGLLLLLASRPLRKMIGNVQ
ncbi:MAG: peptide MFS transporter [Candidatus Sumerlaeia bacterium]|nr:peptide MFS transporter [Candidatus Sumerlaeia bacterium]